MNVVVLGAGLVGGPICLDLAASAEFDVTVADLDPAALARLPARNAGIRTIEADLSDPDRVREIASQHEIVLSAVPGWLGFRVLEAVIESGRSVVDIAFFPEDPFELDSLARRRGVTAIVDGGVAPGMSNLLVGRATADLDRTDLVRIYVGGLPAIREWPFEYRAVFSPIDVIEEYTRPARIVEHGQVVTRDALSEPELLDFDEVGTLEAFNTDGLRTLARTIEAPDMKEKTLRYPGHREKMAVLRATGLFDAEEIEVEGRLVRPIDVAAALLFPRWKLRPGEADLTVMRVVVEGEKEGSRRRHAWELLDRYDPQSGIHSMARTTGYAATMFLRLLATGLYSRTGISPPELMGRDAACTEFVLDGLEKRGVRYVASGC